MEKKDKYIVIESFKDKNTKEICKAGKVIELKNKRAEEILSVGNFIEKIVDKENNKIHENNQML